MGKENSFLRRGVTKMSKHSVGFILGNLLSDLTLLLLWTQVVVTLDPTGAREINKRVLFPIP